MTETQIHERAQYHWKLAWGNVIRGIRSTSMFASYRRNRKSEGKSIPIVKSSAFSEQAFRHLLKSFQTRADLVLNTKVLNVGTV